MRVEPIDATALIELAQAKVRARRFEEAAAFFTQAASMVDDVGLRIVLLTDAADAWAHSNQSGRAPQVIRDLLTLSERVEDKPALAATRLSCSDIYLWLGEDSEARALAESALALLADSDDYIQQVHGHVQLGLLLRRSGDTDAALRHVELAAELATTHHATPDLQVYIASLRADLLLLLGRVDDAAAVLAIDEAIDAASGRQVDPDLQALAASTQADVLLLQDRPDAAARVLTAVGALNRLRDAGPLPVAQALATRGSVLLRLGRVDEARHVVERAREAVEKTNFPETQTYVFGCCGEILMASDDAVGGLHWLRRSAEMSEALPPTDMQIRAFTRYGCALSALSQRDAAHAWLERAATLGSVQKGTLSAQALSAYGALLRQEGRRLEALRWLRSAAQTAESIACLETRADTLLEYGILLFELGETADARVVLEQAAASGSRCARATVRTASVVSH